MGLDLTLAMADWERLRETPPSRTASKRWRTSVMPGTEPPAGQGPVALRQVDALWWAARSVEVSPRRAAERERSVMVGRVDEIAELAALLEVDAEAAPFTCMCPGDISVTVRGELGTVRGVLTLHLGSGLDWSRWPGQFPLLRAEELTEWLIARGVVVPSRGQ
ncbi:hypothetical protein ABZ840_05925 [Streptomyces sp. NPDC047117]|uniref:hypothetical protein n=1 Tax=Streptomyces sp. NPDC047117 TaxID=3155379 RepID=UPI0033F05BE7